MILVRFQNEKNPEIVLNDNEKNIIEKIHELNLCDWHDAFFYERGKFENLGLSSETYDYYSIFDNEESLNKYLANN